MIRLNRILILMLLAVCSCVEYTDLNTNEDTTVSVYCVLKEEDTQVLELCYVRGKGETGFLPVEDAKIYLYTESGLAAEFKQESGVRYLASFRPECGMTYRLAVHIPNRDSLYAEAKMPDDFEVFCFPPRPDYLWLREKCVFSYELRRIDRTVGTLEPSYGEVFAQKCNLWVFPLNQYYYRDLKEGWVHYNDLISTDHPNLDPFNVSGFSLESLPCFSEECMSHYDLSLRQALTWMKEYFPNLPMCRKFVHINQPANFDNGQNIYDPSVVHYSKKSFVLATDFITEYLPWTVSSSSIPRFPLYPGYNIYEFVSVSDGLDKYLRDLYIKDLNRNNMAMLYRTENLYTNIENGVGIFGAQIHRFNRGLAAGYLN